MAKVLVVDDSLSVRKVVERALLGRHIEVVCAATGNEALERIERDEPDVVVCDVVMPDRDGYEICEFVKRHPRLAGTPVLLMSGIVNDEVRQRAAQVQSADVLEQALRRRRPAAQAGQLAGVRVEARARIAGRPGVAECGQRQRPRPRPAGADARRAGATADRRGTAADRAAAAHRHIAVHAGGRSAARRRVSAAAAHRHVPEERGRRRRRHE